MSRRLQLIGADIPDSHFDPRQLRAGTKIEMEHTTDARIAKAIAKGHLIENPRYYDYLKVMEERMERGARPNPRRVNHQKLYTGWHGHDPREVRDYDADFADEYTLVGERATRTHYHSTKIIEPGDDGSQSILYDHEHQQSCQPAQVWVADGRRDPGEIEMVLLGNATLLRYLDPDGDEREKKWRNGAALLCAIDRRTVCVVEPRKHLVTYVMTNVKVTDDGLDDFR